MSVSGVGDKIRQARKRAALTQAELAKRVGVSQKTISRIEGGQDERINTAIPLIMDIASATGVSCWHIIGCSYPDIAVNGDPDGCTPHGLAELASDDALRDALDISDDDIACLARINLDDPITKNGYITLLMAIRAVLASGAP